MMPETIEIASGSDTGVRSWLDRSLARLVLPRLAVLRTARPIVSITFDDVPVSAAINGAGVLNEMDVLGTFYVSAGLAGKRFQSWQYARMDQVCKLHQQGHEIGCHTYSHPDCQKLAPDGLKREIQANRDALKAAMPTLEIDSFAFPYGSVGCAQKLAMMRHFYSLRGTHPSINSRLLDRAQLGSITLNDERTPPKILEKLIAATSSQTGWLILHTHDVQSKPTSEGCTPQLLRSAIYLARQFGCDLMPVNQVMKNRVSALWPAHLPRPLPATSVDLSKS